LPSDYAKTCALLYAEVLERLPDFIDHLDDHRRLWADEDRQLTESEAALARHEIVIEERPEVDLAVVTMDEALPGWSGHRFASRSFEDVHPMALNNATDRFALLVIRGRHYRFTDRYETWVQYRTRRPRPRVDLSALAEQLTAAETDGVTWRADGPGDLMPQLQPVGDAESSIAPVDLVSQIVGYLAEAPPAWDPYEPTV
jgi:hypothetical protein